jgi:hypothetical protein
LKAFELSPRHPLHRLEFGSAGLHSLPSLLPIYIALNLPVIQFHQVLSNIFFNFRVLLESSMPLSKNLENFTDGHIFQKHRLKSIEP